MTDHVYGWNEGLVILGSTAYAFYRKSQLAAFRLVHSNIIDSQ